ncbi:MAG: diversity-generating retroelement protein Avd [Sulfurimonas sp.]|uniref:diversity-generating retroelement protein Avd n=1 Tax=Sulfurimonas sp. TaxID=2022749 RepID=UPI0028CF828A|nr:diversity-generating retroelement protein Avd [Sulfurimonas sp.]MDT8337587.1 diversity-generating retroelement protein Avd [Sulfurimonas sp.]
MSSLVVVEKYDEFVNYIYPVLQNIPRKHGILKEKTIQLVFLQVELFYKAVKSNHVSKLYEADANLALVRYHLRFLASEKRKLVSPKQHQVASILLAEVGKIVGAMIKGR